MKAAEQLDNVSAPLYIPSVVGFELWIGVQRVHRPRVEAERITSFLDSYPVLSLTMADCKEAGVLDHELSRRGVVLPTVDLLLAGMARARSEILLTRDHALLDLAPRVLAQGY